MVTGPDWAVVLDGATAPAGIDSGCVHDVCWLVRQLAAAVASRMPSASLSLADLLAEAITDVRRAHSGTCDLAKPTRKNQSHRPSTSRTPTSIPSLTLAPLPARKPGTRRRLLFDASNPRLGRC